MLDKDVLKCSTCKIALIKKLNTDDFHGAQVWWIHGDLWRDGQAASDCPCGKMKASDYHFAFHTLRLSHSLFAPECTHLQRRQDPGLLGHTVEERSLVW